MRGCPECTHRRSDLEQVTCKKVLRRCEFFSRSLVDHGIVANVDWICLGMVHASHGKPSYDLQIRWHFAFLQGTRVQMCSVDSVSFGGVRSGIVCNTVWIYGGCFDSVCYAACQRATGRCQTVNASFNESATSTTVLSKTDQFQQKNSRKTFITLIIISLRTDLNVNWCQKLSYRSYVFYLSLPYRPYLFAALEVLRLLLLFRPLFFFLINERQRSQGDHIQVWIQLARESLHGKTHTRNSSDLYSINFKSPI